MYIIKIENEKTLVTTMHVPVYCGENCADVFVFLIPKSYNDLNLSDCTVSMHYVLPDGCEHDERLTRELSPYNDRYNHYVLAIDSDFTSLVGEIKLYLVISNAESNLVLRSSSTVVEVMDASDRLGKIK